jgi:hypothetical protein
MISGSVIRKAMVDLRRIDLFESSAVRRGRGDAAVLHADIGRGLIELRTFSGRMVTVEPDSTLATIVGEPCNEAP